MRAGLDPPAVHRLGNGVRVLADPLPGLESLAISVVIDAGSRGESPATSGWAHLLEHMVFKGAGARSAQEIVEAVEGEGGHVNAATGQERTSFQVRCLKDGLPLALEVLSDLVRRPTLLAEDLEREKDVVAQEIAEARDTPDDHVFELAQKEVFGDHPLGRPILGSVESLRPATAKDLRVFHEAHYAPGRMIVSAAGAVDPDELLRLSEAAFGAPAPAQPTREVETAAFRGGHAAEARKLEQSHLVLLLPAVSRKDPDYFAASVFAEIFGGGMASRLFQEVREQRGLAYAIDAYLETYDDQGVLGVYAGTAAGTAEAAARLAAEALKRLTESALPGELRRAKAQIKGSLFMSRETPLARAEANANNLHAFGRIPRLAEIAERIEAVSAADLRRVGERFQETGRSASAVLGPKSALRAGRRFGEALAAG
jgi:predicted Zn-dependent peptidase